MLSRDAILSASDLRPEAVEVPEWGGSVYVRMLTGAERDAFEQSIVQGKGKTRKTVMENIRARLCVLCLCDQAGLRIFGDDDIDALGEKSAAALDRCFAVAQRVNGLSGDDVDDLAGN